MARKQGHGNNGNNGNGNNGKRKQRKRKQRKRKTTETGTMKWTFLFPFADIHFLFDDRETSPERPSKRGPEIDMGLVQPQVTTRCREGPPRPRQFVLS